MNIQFYNRGAMVGIGTNGVKVQVVKYSKRATGGCWGAELEGWGEKAGLLDMLGWLRMGVTIIGDRGQPVWWGYISRVEVTIGKIESQ